MRIKLLFVALALLGPHSVSTAQSSLFDFNNAGVHTPLPIDLMVDGINAHFSYQFYGYSIQRADTMGFTPIAFDGNCIYPSTVYRDDLYVDFSQLLTEFSMLYAPQELACSTSATMRVTAYLDGAYVGTSTTKAPGPGTWPTGQLTFNSAAPFNRVVVHYDAPPTTGGDYGVIFLADNMAVSPLGGPTTETLAPTAQRVNFGRIDGGSLAKLAVQDGQCETVCKFIVPTLASPFIRITLDYTTTKPSPTRIEFFTTSRMANNGSFGQRLSIANAQTGQFDEIMPTTRIGDPFQFGIGRPYAPMSDYVGANGLIQGRIEYLHTGPSATIRPCVDIDLAVMKVSG